MHYSEPIKTIQTETIKSVDLLVETVVETVVEPQVVTVASVEPSKSQVESVESVEPQVETVESIETSVESVESVEPQVESVEQQVESVKVESVEQQVGSVVQQVESVEQQVESVVQQVESVGNVEPQVESVGQQVESVEQQVESVEPQVESVGSVVQQVESVGSVEPQVESVEQQVESVVQHVESVGTQVESVETQVEIVGTLVESVETQVESIGTLVESVETQVESVVQQVEIVETQVESVETQVESVETQASSASTKADSSKKIITFYMNCHGEFLARTLLTSKDFFRNYLCKYVVTFQAIRRGNFTQIELDHLNNCDIIIYNPVSDKHKEFSYQHVLKNFVKPSTQRICIPYYRFTGYWPSFETRTLGTGSMVKQFDALLVDQLDSLMGFKFLSDTDIDPLNLQMILNKLCINENKNEKLELLKNVANPKNILKLLANIYSNQETHLALHLKNAFDTFDQLDNLGNFRMQEYLRNNWRKEKLFDNYAHPTPTFYIELAKRVFGLLGLKKTNQIVIRKKTRSVEEEPIFPSIKKMYQLKFDENPILLNEFAENLSIYYYLHTFPTHFSGTFKHISRKILDIYKDVSNDDPTTSLLRQLQELLEAQSKLLSQILTTLPK